MTSYIAMAAADQITFFLRVWPNGETTISCRACKMKDIRYEETEIEYHLLSRGHQELHSQFRGSFDNNDSEFKVANCESVKNYSASTIHSIFFRSD